MRCIFRLKTYPHNIGPNHIEELVFCDECVQEKQCQKMFSKDKALPTDKLLGVVHTNI
jgi:hypothetical protein